LLHNDVPVPGMSETRTLYGMNSTKYKRETFSFDVNQLGVGKCSIKLLVSKTFAFMILVT
jgi:hypothetical protein